MPGATCGFGAFLAAKYPAYCRPYQRLTGICVDDDAWLRVSVGRYPSTYGVFIPYLPAHRECWIPAPIAAPIYQSLSDVIRKRGKTPGNLGRPTRVGRRLTVPGVGQMVQVGPWAVPPVCSENVGNPWGDPPAPPDPPPDSR
jgi:hypothetical protein